jgi:hypothetical protein
MRYKLFIILLIIIPIISCKKEKETIYYNFTDDELSFILLKDSAIGDRPVSYYSYYHIKYLLNNTDTIKVSLTKEISQSRYYPVDESKYMIQARFKINYLLQDYSNTIYFNLIKNDSYCNEILYKSISVKYTDTASIAFNDCENTITKCFETECCNNSNNFVIDTVEYKGVNYQSYIFDFSDEETKIKQIIFIKNIGFVYISDKENNKMTLI